MDNYAEKFSDLTPYQYTANNPVYFIDVNGEYIYIWDDGKRDYLKFEELRILEQNENNNFQLTLKQMKF